MKKQIAILGSTGSIGTQALDVIAAHPDLFEVNLLTANEQWEKLCEQARRFLPDCVVIANKAHYQKTKEALEDLPIKVFAGNESIDQMVENPNIDMVLTALVGFAGLSPTVHAIKSGRPIALANKETLVVAGELINDLAAKHHTPIIPVDSEHSAIFQCLAGEVGNVIEELIITASGGPFRCSSQEEMAAATVQRALQHPKWHMGAKITIDSATMMNKGFEVIEAKWLFGVDIDQIKVLVHPQSIVHSMVQFADGAIKAQLGVPDMKIPIQYAFSYPDRLPSNFDRVDWMNTPNFTFEQPDTKKFRNLSLAYEAIRKGGNAPCTLNAANEIAVRHFLGEHLGFLDMSDVVAETMLKTQYISRPTMEELFETDKEARRIAESIVLRLRK